MPSSTISYALSAHISMDAKCTRRWRFGRRQMSFPAGRRPSWTSRRGRVIRSEASTPQNPITNNRDRIPASQLKSRPWPGGSQPGSQRIGRAGALLYTATASVQLYVGVLSHPPGMDQLEPVDRYCLERPGHESAALFRQADLLAKRFQPGVALKQRVVRR
jgi:hypothetical protein